MAGGVTNPIELAIEAQSRTDQKRLWLALEMIAAVDGYVGMTVDPETGQTVLGGETEAQLELVIERLQREFDIAINVGAPQVAYRETPGHATEVKYVHKVQRGGAGEFALVRMAFEPGASGSGYRFENRTPDAAVPRALVRGVEKGLEAARQLGATHGFPVIDFTAILLDGAFHAQDSTLLTFEIAARAAFREAMQKAQCQLLEPIMKVEVALPMSFAHEIIDAIAADLDQRRCEHRGLEERGNIGVLRAFVPLANMFGYGNTLRALTQRRGTFDMVFDHYAPIPGPDDEPFRPAVGMRA